MLSSLRKFGSFNPLALKRQTIVLRLLATTATKKPSENGSINSNPSFVHNIFRGQLEHSELFPYPMPLNDEQLETIKVLIDPMENFFKNINKPEISDQKGEFDPKVIDTLWDLGGFGIAVPEKYGGLGLNYTQLGRLTDAVGGNDLAIATMLGAHQSIGYKGILLYGTDEQKAKYLPQVSSGKVFAAFALTEPSAGSDVASIKTRAVKSSDGKHYILNGSKIWITNGGIAEIMTVFARTEVIDDKGIKKDKITAFIVEKGFGGVTCGPPEKKLGIKASNTTEVYFDDVKVPIENILGNIGDGFKVAVNILNNGRFGMGMALGGTMRMCIKRATEHVTQRETFGNKLESYGGIQEKIARMSMLQYVNQSIAYMLSGNMDLGSNDFHLEAAISKVFASDSAWYICDETIQILGGMGFMVDAGIERFLRDLRIYRIYEGANDILKLFIALTGMQYAGNHLKQVQKALKNPAMNLGLIFKEVSKKYGFGGVDMTTLVHPSLNSSAKLCGESIDAFGQTVTSLLIKYGKNIVHEQFHLNRIAESAIDIHAMACVLSRASTSIKLNLPSVDHEKLMVDAWCVEAHDRVQVNMRKIKSPEFNENFKRMSQISKNSCHAKDVVQMHPVGF
ncbi:very long-chain specific acyl-CoA dehydrogenase, mitochondrial-like isoform X1 [Chironomus tepperi]|uniref:very long-chain specific acyl-CoA dehydrogenase, mitochondrial-like isoform X1 n=2 Tax=Chironomus tepperi TaxID=113505 RepID=UPI00391FAE89